MRVIICGGRNYKLTGDDIDLLYDLKPLIGEVVSGMSGAVKMTHDKNLRLPGVKGSDKDRWAFRTDLDLENLEKTYGYDEIKGADLWAAKWALDNRVPVKPFPILDSEWRTYGRSAGPKRNLRMVRYAEGGGIIAFPGGRGTVNCCRQAKDHGLVPIYVKPVEEAVPEMAQMVEDFLTAKRLVEEQEVNPDVKLDDVAWWAMRKPKSVNINKQLIIPGV